MGVFISYFLCVCLFEVGSEQYHVHNNYSTEYIKLFRKEVHQEFLPFPNTVNRASRSSRSSASYSLYSTRPPPTPRIPSQAWRTDHISSSVASSRSAFHLSSCLLVSFLTLLYSMSNERLPPDVNRILYIRNLPFKATSEELYAIFGRYGPIRQVRACRAVKGLTT